VDWVALAEWIKRISAVCWGIALINWKLVNIMGEVKRFAFFRSAMEAVKHRLKLTWIGWLYICARRSVGGSVLLVLIALSLLLGIDGLFQYLSIRKYQSWESLPCQAGVLLDVVRPRRGLPAVKIVDNQGEEHIFYGSALTESEKQLLDASMGEVIDVCFVFVVSPVLFRAFRKMEVITSHSNGGRLLLGPGRTFFDSVSYRKSVVIFWLIWVALPMFLWLIKRHARVASRERRLYIDCQNVRHT
jgi:hypothetical protein